MSKPSARSIVVALNGIVMWHATMLAASLLFILILALARGWEDPGFYPALGMMIAAAIASLISIVIIYRIERPDRTPVEELHWVLRRPALGSIISLSPTVIIMKSFNIGSSPEILAPAFLAFCSLVFLLSAKFLADNRALSEEKNDEPPSRQGRQEGLNG